MSYIEKKETTLLDSKFFYENKTFNEFIYEQNKKIEDDSIIKFKNCTFNLPVVFENININYQLSFTDCIFKKEVFIYNSNISLIEFSGCKIFGELKLNLNVCRNYLILRNVIASNFKINGEYNQIQIVSSEIDTILIDNVNSKSTLKDSTIEFLVENKIKKLRIEPFSTYSQIIFKGGVFEEIYFEGDFNNKVFFKKIDKVEYLYFESSSFKKRIDIQEGEYRFVTFYRSNFNGLIHLSDFDGDNIIESKNLSFESLSIHSCSFNKDVSVSISKILYISLSNNNFNQQFFFNNYLNQTKLLDKNKIINFRVSGVNRGVILIQRAYIDITLSGVNFGDIFIKDSSTWSLFLWELENKGTISLSNINKGDFFTISDSVSGKINFINSDINDLGETVISNSNIEDVNFVKYPKKIHSFSTNKKVGYGLTNKSENNSNLKSVYNQIKQTARKKGDIDIANKFQSLEYKKLLLSKRLGFDSILLFLNWISNNNGRSWFRGVLFTIFISFIFYNLYIDGLKASLSNQEFIKDYILFLTSFPKLQLEKYSELNNQWNISLIIWLSRIFISYGIYQVVASFRKYGK